MAASELLMTNGGTPATPASGKTKLFINASKQLAQIDDAGLVTVPTGQNAQSQATPADPTGTTNTTGLMMGVAGAVTPVYTGRVLIMISGDVQSTLSGDGAKFQIRYGTGAAPANAAALTGTAVGGLVNMLAAANNQRVPFSLQAIVTGLTLATAIWIDIGLAAVTGGTAAIKNLSISAVEF
jgi:hypothetical protein